MWYEKSYAYSVYTLIHKTYNGKLIYNNIEDILISNWVEYSRIMIKESHLFE